MYEQKTLSYAHQTKELAEHALDDQRAIFWVPRTGKTKLTIDSFCMAVLAGKVTGLFVLAPSGPHINWVTDELPLHMPLGFQKTTKAEYYSSKKAGTKAHDNRIRALLSHTTGLSILTMSYDAFYTDNGRKVAKQFLTTRRCMGVADESWRIKNPSAKVTKLVVSSNKYLAMSRILNGTPVSNSPFDVYSQIKFLDEDFWKRHDIGNFSAFKADFGIFRKMTNSASGRDFDLLVAYRRLDRLHDMLKPIMSRVTEEDAVLNLPEKIYSKRYFEMTPKQASLYQTMKDEFLLEMDSGEIISATLVMVRMMRLQQITSGYVSEAAEEPRIPIPGPNPRLDVLMDLVDQRRDHHGIIWARFTPDVDMICEAFKERGIPFVRYDGKVKEEERKANKERFQTGEDTTLWLVGNQSVGGSGIPLFRGKTMVFYSNNFKLTDRLQAEERHRKIDKLEPVEIIDIIAPGTVDEHIVEALRRKINIASQVTGDQLREFI